MPYFDHNATTPLSPEAGNALAKALENAWHNPSSPYRASARVHRLLEEAREEVATVLKATTAEIIFTGGATEANNAVLSWAARELPAGKEMLVSRTEHPSVIEAAQFFFRDRLRWLDVDTNGLPDLEQLKAQLATGEVGLVAAMAANNETGVINPIAEIGAACRVAGAYYLCDASQWIGRLPAARIPANAFALGCAHKFGGPKGVGFLRVPTNVGGFRAAVGGEQEGGRRAGTENFPGIAAMVAALRFSELQETKDQTGWRDAFIAKVTGELSGVRVNGGGAPRLWNTVSLCMPEHENTRWVTRLDKAGFQVSTGSACATGSSAPSHVLAAMGLDPEEARRTIRISSGWETAREDWDALADVIVGLANGSW